jgi:hypothetical protein
VFSPQILLVHSSLSFKEKLKQTSEVASIWTQTTNTHCINWPKFGKSSTKLKHGRTSQIFLYFCVKKNLLSECSGRFYLMKAFRYSLDGKGNKWAKFKFIKKGMMFTK